MLFYDLPSFNLRLSPLYRRCNLKLRQKMNQIVESNRFKNIKPKKNIGEELYILSFIMPHPRFPLWLYILREEISENEWVRQWILLTWIGKLTNEDMIKMWLLNLHNHWRSQKTWERSLTQVNLHHKLQRSRICSSHLLKQ